MTGWRRISVKPATREFFAIALSTMLVNILFQVVFGLVSSIHPVVRGALETFAVALFVVPPAYYFYMRPFLISLSERQAGEKMLRKSEMHYRIISELTTNFVFDLHVAEDGTISLDFVSDNFYSFAGRTDRGASFESLLSHIHPEDRGKLVTVLRGLVAQPKSHEVECRVYMSETHELKWLSISGRSEWDDESGRVTAIYGAVKDITERKKSEEALKESEEKFRSITEQSADGIVATDENGIIVEWNKAQEALTGLKRGDVIGLAAWEAEGLTMPKDLNAPGQIARIREKVTGLLHGDPDFPVNERVEHPIILPDGGSRMISEHIFVIKKSGGNMIVSIMTDITEKKRAESERATVEQYLQQTQKLESLGVLAGGIAHDFNNLLSGVFGFMDLARSRVLDQTASEYLARAGESIERAKGLTQQLLTFSKGGEPIRKLVPLAPLIRETCHFALSGANVKCSYRIGDDLWRCNVDRNQIGQVIQNLMLNAIQAMPMGGVIDVLAENVSLGEKEHPLLARGDYVRVAIRDSGTGIAKEILPRIFDPFFTTKTKGHGLGLATTFSIVKRHNGTINVESELGAGSTFQIYLPADSTAFSESIGAREVRHSGKGRVLVMDDDEAIRVLLSKTLESLGYSVVCKEDGVSTIGWFKAEAEKGTLPSAVMLDLTIPGGMGGREVAEEIRKLNKEMPIFVSSGYAEDPVIANPTDYGITASLSKPFKRAELAEMLEKHMRKAP